MTVVVVVCATNDKITSAMEVLAFASAELSQEFVSDSTAPTALSTHSKQILNHRLIGTVMLDAATTVTPKNRFVHICIMST